MHREARISNYILAAFSIISLTLMSLPLSGPVRSFKACASYVLDPVAFYSAKGSDRLASVPATVRDLLAADSENRLLREEMRKASLVKAEADSLKVENERLRAALGLKAPPRFEPLWAHVMERSPLNWYRSVLVDAGSEQGVAVNAPVLGGRGEALVAIGRIIEVRPKSSVVLLLTDQLSSVASYLTSPSTAAAKNLEGLVQGQDSSRLRMNYLSPEVAVEKGDLVLTSPTSATFPPDMLIGTVAKVYPLDPFLTFQSVEVGPAVDASFLKEVMILKRQAPSGAPKVAAAPPEPVKAAVDVFEEGEGQEGQDLP